MAEVTSVEERLARIEGRLEETGRVYAVKEETASLQHLPARVERLEAREGRIYWIIFAFWLTIMLTFGGFYLWSVISFSKTLRSEETLHDGLQRQINDQQRQIEEQQREFEQQRRKLEELKRRTERAEKSAYPSSKSGVVVNIPDILFEFGKADLTADAQAKVKEIVRILNGPAQGRKVAVDGYTDSTEGNEEYTEKLSEQRAQAVADALVAEGVDGKRLTVKGYGERYPIALNTNPDGSDNPTGRAKNRRVEVVIVN